MFSISLSISNSNYRGQIYGKNLFFLILFHNGGLIKSHCILKQVVNIEKSALFLSRLRTLSLKLKSHHPPTHPPCSCPSQNRDESTGGVGFQNNTELKCKQGFTIVLTQVCIFHNVQQDKASANRNFKNLNMVTNIGGLSGFF